MELNKGRQQGLGPNPLPWQELSDYAARNGVDGEEFDEFCYFLQEMDRTFLDLVEEKRKKNAPKQPPQKNRRK